MEQRDVEVPTRCYDLWHAVEWAIEEARTGQIQFKWNDWVIPVGPGDSMATIQQYLRDNYEFELLSPEDSAAKARADMEEMERSQAQAIDDAGVGTEAQMKDAEVPTFDTLTELATYVDSLTERPHDYDTCVYAMSMAAVAAFNYVARQLQVTGFQASCADMDIIRRTRRIKGAFRITNYETLLFPQYATRGHFPTYMDSLQYHKEWLQEQATQRLKDDPLMHREVRQHLEWLAAGQPMDMWATHIATQYQLSVPDLPYMPEEKEPA